MQPVVLQKIRNVTFSRHILIIVNVVKGQLKQLLKLRECPIVKNNSLPLSFTKKMIIKIPSFIYLIKTNKGGILVNYATRESVQVNNTAFEWLNFLDNDFKYVDSIINKIVENYPQNKEEIIKDFHNLIAQLEEIGFLWIKEKKIPRSLMIELTKQCNERCLHCYIPNKNKSKERPASSKLIVKALKEFKDCGGEEIIFTGGEALLHSDINQLLEYSCSLGLKNIIYSNLTLLNIDNLQKLKDGKVKYIQTSLYGHVPEIHDSITQNEGSFERSLKNIKLLREHNISVKIVCVLMKSNYKYLCDIINLIKELNCAIGIETVLTSCYDGNKENTNQRLDLEEIKNVLVQLKNIDEELFFDTVRLKCHEEELDDPFAYINTPVCDGGIDTLYLTSEGKLTPCPQLLNYVFGDLSKESFHKILNNEFSNKLNSITRSSFRDCLKCDAYEYCKWCIGLSYTENGNILNYKGFWCNLAQIAKDIVVSTL